MKKQSNNNGCRRRYRYRNTTINGSTSKIITNKVLLLLVVAFVCFSSTTKTTTNTRNIISIAFVAAETEVKVTATTKDDETSAAATTTTKTTTTDKDRTSISNTDVDDGEDEDEQEDEDEEEEDEDEEEIQRGVIELTSKNFDQMVLSKNNSNNEEIWFIEFYAPWCSHCQRLEPTWNELAKYFDKYNDDIIQKSSKDKKDKDKKLIRIGKINGQQDRTLSSRFHIRGYPSLYRIEGKYNIREYQDRTRTIDNLKSFILDETDYEQVSTLNFWTKSPFGPIGMTKSYVMSLGTMLIDTYTYMDKEGYSKVTMGAMFLFGVIIMSFCMVLCIGFCLIPNDIDDKEKCD